MKRKKRITRIAACLLIPAITAVSVIAGSLIKTSPPDNPLLIQSDTVDIDDNHIGILGLPQDFLSNIKQPEINNEDSKSSQDSSDNDHNSSESENDSKNIDIKNNQNNIYSSLPSGVSGTNSLNSNDSNDNEDVRSGDSSKNSSDISGDNRTPSGNKTDIDYFTATIKDGEILYSRNYSFKIIHNQKSLKVKSTSVFVNGIKQTDFNGRILLSEGENIIRIEASYTDKNAKLISAYRDYKVFVELGDIILTTDLTDKTVDTDIISFAANAFLDKEAIPITVQCNEMQLSQTNGQYTAKLSENENNITISAQWHRKKISKAYKIIYTPVKNFEIKTSLSDCTVNDSSFSFTAVIQNGSEKSKLNITFNGSALSVKNNGSYTVNLKNGSNKIRLKATDIIEGQNVVITQNYTVKYVPLADEHTAPHIEYINVSKDMTIKGSDFTLNILPLDYLGNRIYHDGITVQLNGSVIYYEGENKFTDYDLYFNGGINELNIRITDKDGRYTDYSYDINCISVADGEELGEITISVDANVLGLGYLSEPTKITIRQGEAASYTIVKFLEEQGFSCEYSNSLTEGFYLSRINKTGIGIGAKIPQELADEINKNGLGWNDQKYDDSIGEYDYSLGSGWVISVNDIFIGRSLSNAKLKDGYTVRIRFTLAHGKDVGAGYDLGYESNFNKIW